MTTLLRLKGRLGRPRELAARLRAQRAQNLAFLRVARTASTHTGGLPSSLNEIIRSGSPAWLKVWGGITSWATAPGARSGATEVVRRALDGADASSVRRLADLLAQALPRDAEVRELAGTAAVLEGRTEDAEAHFSHALEGSVERRRRNAERRASHVANRAALRAAVAGHAPAADHERERGEVLALPFTREGALEHAAELYAIRQLASADHGLDGIVDALVKLGRLPVSEADVPAVDDLVDQARARADDADYLGALRLLERVPARPEALTESYLTELARAQAAVSAYAAARTTLRVLGGSKQTAGAAGAREAHIAWVVHDYAGALEAARRATRGGASQRSVAGIRARSENPITPSKPSAGGVGHVAFFVDKGENFGDVALPAAVRLSIEEAAGSQAWLPFHAHQVFDDGFVRAANAQKALVVGGGGLFLPDTSPNGNSGWQWNVPPASLDAIQVPLFVYSVGYNLFPGQEFQGSLFRDNLVALAHKAEFLGLRNHGSMQRVRDLLPPALQEKVQYLPCPTTVLERLRSDLPDAESGSGLVLVNAAFDRSARRFGDTYGDFLAQIHHFVTTAEKSGAEVRFVAHTRGDVKLAADLHEAYGLERPVDELHEMEPDEAYGVYRRASLVIGMRGHATMIPFGLGTPVVSIVSHPKMRYFLEDIGRTEWGYDVHDAHLGADLAERTADVLAREQAYRDDVHGLQDGLLATVRKAATAVAAQLA